MVVEARLSRPRRHATAHAIEPSGELSWRDRDAEALCQSCGACCSFSAEWPRFSLEDDAALERIPPALVAETGSGMRCAGDRCAALVGVVGQSTSCTIYALRPDVCRACLPGDDACLMARRRFDL